MIDDLYAVQTQPGSDAESEIAVDNDVFYATSVNQSGNQELKEAFMKCGAVFVIVGTKADVYLMGVVGPEGEEPQEFTFIPSCCEEASEADSKVHPSVDLANDRSKRGLADTLKGSASETRLGNVRARLQGSSILGGFKEGFQSSFGSLFASLGSFLPGLSF